jgi:hypothetical protein
LKANPLRAGQRCSGEPRAQRMHIETLVAIGVIALVVISVTTVMAWIVR